jgi:hypothetical protein
MTFYVFGFVRTVRLERQGKLKRKRKSGFHFQFTRTVRNGLKLVLIKKLSSRVFNRVPINFWEPDEVEEDFMTSGQHTKMTFVMKSSMILPIRRVTHTNCISNPSHTEIAQGDSLAVVGGLNANTVCSSSSLIYLAARPGRSHGGGYWGTSQLPTSF